MTCTAPVGDRRGRLWQGFDGRRWASLFSSFTAPIGVGLSGTLLLTVALCAVLLAANPGASTPAAVLDLALALGWVAVVMNAAFVFVVTLAHAGLARVWPAVFRGRRLAFLLGGLLGLHVAWMLFNRLTLVQLLVHDPPFVRPSGLIQAAAICGVVGLLICAAMLSVRRPARAVVAMSAALLLAASTLLWNASQEVVFRTYSMDRVRAAAAWGGPGWAASAAAVNGPVIVLGLDGWGWDVVVPLLEAGLMPHTAALVQQGAVGYLDNGDDSFSPRIWNTIFTGRPVEEHGIYDFVALHLPRSGQTLANLVSQKPAIDSVYGIKQLLRRLPSLGLWELVALDSTDVTAKSIWDIASEHDRRVVVANVLNSVPARPVRGAMVSLEGNAAEAAFRDFYPAELAGRWVPHETRGDRKRSLSAWQDAIASEVDFTLALFRESEIDLGIYYSLAVDRIAHHNWDFYTPDAWIRTEVPADLTDGAWEALVARSADAPVFSAYRMLDEQLGRIRHAHPDATFVLASDHGWTFSGYQHYGSQDGILLVSGPRARAGATIEGARIEDVLPTLLAMLGVPISDELPGRVLDDALAITSRPAAVATYGPEPEGDETSGVRLDDAALSQLEELGYLR